MSRIDGVEGNGSIFANMKMLCFKNFGLAFKIHEGPVNLYVSQYTERNKTDFTFRDKKKHRTPTWKTPKCLFFPPRFQSL